MINALGLMEVRGLVTAIEAADAMLKAADVRLMRQWRTEPGLISLVVEGDLAACRAALDAGEAAARRLGEVVSRCEIGRPDPDTETLVGTMLEPPASIAPPATPRFDEAEVIARIAAAPAGMSLVELQTAFPFVGVSRAWLQTQCREGRLVRRRGRYFGTQDKE
ncbi:BMC domain-containing protein [Paludibacterium paludis]|uniref:Ethanolamine utilization protein EutK n=1 Tax=Paludibacterium paludis TaxID=1225769 RepID=A0A918U6P1_9NEIS|nr:BMC domain-containing protein [Paludibacterium paludis]GGY02225.1 ethanolamine utilization protein EutK [Paludibacterium paludis]